MKKFSFPDFYDYPPFWTKQPNEEMFSKQVELWSSLICSFCKAINKTQIQIDTALDTILFRNDKIKRHLSRETLISILDKMEETGRARYTSPEKSSVKIYWITIEEWAKKLCEYGNKYGNGPYTFRELVEGEDISDRPFQGMDYNTLQEVVQYLVKNEKATYMNSNRPSLPEHGVKLLL